MALIDKELKDILWAASSFAMEIGLDGSLPKDYKSYARYKRSKFKGDLCTFVDKDNHYNAGYVGLSDIGIIVSFRGTKCDSPTELKDWINNIKVKQVDFAPYGKVHKGFLGAVKNIQEEIIKKIKELLNEDNSRKLYITGHSKGGAMAFLMACMAETVGLTPLVVTFGAPRVGDKEFVKNYNIETYRYESFVDAIPHLPFTKDEKILLKRLSSVYEEVIDNIDSEAIKIILGFTALSDYFPVGKRIVIDVNHGKYSNIPKNIDKTFGEALNSFCAVEWMVREGEFKQIMDIHNSDYSK
ncbi:lipase family protein [uncultured Clostridium sp.]|uniref:lipase family protein n=1 Tax=uncultured Clostridium sp. TaxID=59620 RepID=UPI0025F53D4F|nr:lipase family protein [uncultured Clostridium sp.]